MAEPGLAIYTLQWGHDLAVMERLIAPSGEAAALMASMGP